MYELWRRHRRALLTAAGATGVAVGGWWWWNYYVAGDSDGSKQHESILQLDALMSSTEPTTSLLSAELVDHAEAQPVDDTPYGNELDRSLHSHFSYIQEEVTPKELEELLPRVQALLFEMTDFQLVKQRLAAMTAAAASASSSQPPGGTGGTDAGRGAASPAGQGAVPPAGPAVTAEEKARMLAAPCFTRAIAACWLVPLVDLFLRVKLNLLGRHMFLQEKLGQLRHSPAVANERPHLPPRLTGLAMESFLKFDHFSGRGSRCLISKVAEVVATTIAGLPSMKEMVGPSDVSRLLMEVLTASEAAACPVSWADVLLGPETGEGLGHPASGNSRMATSASMVEELNLELRSVITDYRFKQAVRAAAHYSFRIVMQQLHSSFPTSPSVPPALHSTSPATGASPSARPRQQQPQDGLHTAGPGAMSPVPGSTGRLDASSPASGSTGSTGSDTEGVQRVGGTPVMVPRFASDGGATASPSPLDVPPVSLTSPGRTLPRPQQASLSSRPQGGGGTFVSAFMGSFSSLFGISSHELGGSSSGPLSPGLLPSLLRLGSPRSRSTSTLSTTPSSRPGGAVTLLPSRSLRVGARGSGDYCSSLQEAQAGRQVPLPQLFKPLYDACGPLFSNTKQVTKGISSLQPVMSLCACAFASTPGQH